MLTPAPRTEVGDTPEVVGEVRWRKPIKTAVNENSELVLDPLLYLQPVQLLQKLRRGIVLPQRERETSSGIQHGLQSADGVGWNTR